MKTLSDFSNCLYYISVQTFASTEVYKYSKDDYTAYGFDDPFVVLTVNYLDESGADSIFTCAWATTARRAKTPQATSPPLTDPFPSTACPPPSRKITTTIATGMVPDTGTAANVGSVDIPYQQPDL
jgi:hypothetical protein